MKVFVYEDELAQMKDGKTTLIFMSAYRKSLEFFESSERKIIEVELGEVTNG